MDIEGICSDLQSLSKLYGLLKTDGQSLPNESSEGLSVPTKLDQQARLLLRDLLDDAAERIFNAHTEILAVRCSVDASCSSQQGESKDMLKLQPPLFLENASSNSKNVLQSTSKKINTQKEVSEKDKWVPIDPTSQSDSSEQSRLKIFGSEPQARKKRCRVCLRSILKQPKVLDRRIQNPNKCIGVQSQLHNPSFEFHAGDHLLVEGKMSSNKSMHSANDIKSQRQKGSFKHQSSPVGVGRESACSSDKPGADIVESGVLRNFSADPVKKSEEADLISKEASIKIQLIESRMSALLVAAKPAHTLQIQTGAPYGWNELTSISDNGSGSVSSMLQRKKWLVTRNELSEVGDFVVGRSDPKSRPLGRKVWEPTQWHQVPNQVRKTKLSNQANSRILKPLPPSGALIRQTVTQTAEKDKQIAFEYDRLSEVRNPIEGCKVPDQEKNQVPVKNVKAIIDRIESLSQVTGKDDHTPMQANKFIQGLRLPANRNRIASTDLLLPAKLQSQLARGNLDRNRTRLKKTIPIVETSLSSNWSKTVNTDLLLPAKLQNQLEKEKSDQNRTTLKKKIPIVETSESSTPSVGPKFITRHNSKLPASNVGSGLNRTWTKAATLMPPHRMTMHTLPDHKSSQSRVSSTSHEDRPGKWQGSFQKRKNRAGTRRFIFPRQQVSESTSSRSHYSSSWESQQVSTSFSDDEGYSVSGQTGTRQSSDPSTSSESVVYSHHYGRTGAPKMIYSSSDSEMYSVSSRSRGHQLDSDSSSESQESLSSDRSPVHGHIGSLHQSVGSTSRRMDLAKSHRLEKKPQVGKLKKLKDKLEIIFHHHHHHHHHHHDHGDDDNQHVEVRGGKSLWKHAGKIFDKRSKEEAYGEQAVKKIRKSAAGSAQDKNQRGHFHTLVEGLLQHVRHSKKSKVAKGGIARPGNGQHGAKKKKVKKLHWWQMLQHQRGLKMPKKPRGTLGVVRKNPKLKALPKPR